MKKDIEKLNEAQKKAVLAQSGPLLVIAGAGSGKTNVLTHRIANHIASGIQPDSICAVTFTNKAAEEMLTRVLALLRENKIPHRGAPFIGTFHKLGIRILREEAERAGLKSTFVIFDESDQQELVKDVLLRLELSKDEYKPASLREAISSLKAELIDPEEYRLRASTFFESVVRKAYAGYQESLKQHNALDFDDIIFYTVKLFLSSPETLLKYQKRFAHIFVDEYQDTNLAQYVLMNLLAKESKSIFVVGDIDQSIYGWRGADYRNILRFEIDYPDHTTIYLEENYRSTKKIVQAGASVIANNASRKENILWTNNEEGENIKIVLLDNEKEEAGFIADEIRHTLKEEKLQDIAVLYRTNAQSRAIEAALLKAAIPYRLVGGVRFFDRREVRDILAYLRFLANPHDILALKRILNVPLRGLSGLVKSKDLGNFFDPETLETRPHNALSPRQKRGLDAFFAMLRKIKTAIETELLGAAIKTITKEIAYKEYLFEEKNGEERWENILELLTLAKEYDGIGRFPLSIHTFLGEASLASALDEKEKTEAVHLMTLHAAKGLEFKTLFIAGLEEGLFPGRRSENSERELEEERRLAYVGITRAKKNLSLLFTKQRTIFGSTLYNAPSRFLAEIPEHLVEFVDLSSSFSEEQYDEDGIEIGQEF